MVYRWITDDINHVLNVFGTDNQIGRFYWVLLFIECGMFIVSSLSSRFK